VRRGIFVRRQDESLNAPHVVGLAGALLIDDDRGDPGRAIRGAVSIERRPLVER